MKTILMMILAFQSITLAAHANEVAYVSCELRIGKIENTKQFFLNITGDSEWEDSVGQPRLEKVEMYYQQYSSRKEARLELKEALASLNETGDCQKIEVK